jgi:uncharacterized protein YecE (DUF72 family)
MLPYFLGCPSWSEPAWRGQLYPVDSHSNEFLALYARVFNAVEGNTTFYAEPSAASVARWAQQMPAHFRFCAKLPRTVSHAGDLREQLDQAMGFRRLLAPLGARVSPYWLQLPASFGPQRLAELGSFVEPWAAGALAVEVRHPAFFARGEEERRLNRLLHERGIERICLDARALFSCRSADAAVLHAQAKKPRLPLRPTAFSQAPQLRFIGHPELPANDPFMAPWLDKVAAWVEEGRTPHQLVTRLPGLPALPDWPKPAAELQLGLL